MRFWWLCVNNCDDRLSSEYPLQSRPQADTVARLAFEKLQLGETVSPELLDATYLRRSEAEIKFAERAR